MLNSSFLLVASLLSFALPLVLGWGQIGHAAIANTAWELMDSGAKAKATSYLPSGYSMEAIASFADTYAESPQGNWSAHLHYINMNQGQTEFEMSVDCTNGCVVSAILNNTMLLINDKFLASLASEPNPFEFVVHFVGDVHQPLHVGWGSDRGGNEVKVEYFTQSTELHAVWDTGMITTYSNDWSVWSADLLKEIKDNQTMIAYYTQNMDPSAWADESFSYVENDVYNFDPSPKASGTPYLASHYYDHNLPIVRERLIAASIRLAALLNKIFG